MSDLLIEIDGVWTLLHNGRFYAALVDARSRDDAETQIAEMRLLAGVLIRKDPQSMPDPRESSGDDRLMTETETAELLRLSPKTLQNYRTQKRGGPEWVKVGRNVRYRRSVVLAYMRAADTAGMLLLFAELFGTYA